MVSVATGKEWTGNPASTSGARQVVVPFDLDTELTTVVTLLTRYQSVPVPLADGELVRMAELYPNSMGFTLDSDLRI